MTDTPLSAEELAELQQEGLPICLDWPWCKNDCTVCAKRDSRWDKTLATIDALTTENATLKAEIEGYRQALEGLLPLTDEFEYTLYGNFMGGDPRDFVPDEEVCTPEEITAWAAACEEWNRGEGVDRGSRMPSAGRRLGGNGHRVWDGDHHTEVCGTRKGSAGAGREGGR